jgi:hypothetical protein
MLSNSVLSTINLLAVLVAGVVHLVLGLVWFQPKLFGNAWASLTGKDLKPASRWIPAGVIAHLLMAFVLAVIVRLANATTALDGALVGILVCLGFVATMEAGELVWEKIPFRLFMIRVGNQLLGFAISGIILAVWR